MIAIWRRVVKLSLTLLTSSELIFMQVIVFQTSTSANQLSPLKRPLMSNVVAMATDITNICGRRIVLGGATPDSVGQVRNTTTKLEPKEDEGL